MGPVGPDTDGDRPRGKSQLEVVLTGVAVIVGVAPIGAHHIDPDHSRQVSPRQVSVVSKIALEHLMYFASGYSA